MPLDNFHALIVSIEEFDIRKETIDIINNSQEYLTELLKDQLALGKDGNKEEVEVFGHTYYSQRAKKEKKNVEGLGGNIEWITNYMTGAFYANMRVDAAGTKFTFSSSVGYFDQILVQSGEVIMELNIDHLEQFSNEILKPRLQEAFELSQSGI